MSENNNNQNYSGNPFFDSRTSPDQRQMADIMYRSMRRALHDESASNPGGFNPSNSSQSFFSDRRDEMQYKQRDRYEETRSYLRSGNITRDFTKGIENQLLNSLTGGDFKKGMNRALATFSKQFGVELKDLPGALGKNIGKQIFGDGKNSILNKALQTAGNKLAGSNSELGKAVGNVINSAAGSGVKAAGQAMGDVAAGGAQVTGAMGELTAVASAAAPVILGVVIAAKLLKPAFEGLVKLSEALQAAATRREESRKKQSEEAQKRLKADMEYMAREPFEILMNAAKKWEDAWDANLAKISLTQGYTKEDVYDLYSSVSERLISEGLGSVIPATDIINNLSSVLESGLSGKIAEEFAYEATKLTAAVPTENFLSYGSTYAQLISDATAQGMAQAEAVQYANQQLEAFANNLLYSSRNLSGGLGTGLKDASNLLSSAVAIAQSAKSGNAADISGTLTSVSAIVSSVAPDLASGLVDNVVKAAIGGNSDTIVALRSLSGMNASNTEFLKQLANDPQGLFVTIFKNLANMQNMSPDNYMEVAEGLSSIFGIDMKAFARVDFNNLADKIAEMNINSGALSENMSLLASGEATMSTEQLKLQEINNTILEEGLAYVIDSEAGRMVQQHMWEEQIAQQMQEATYAVEIQGSALAFLEGIRETIVNLLNFLNPISYAANSIANMDASVKEVEERREDIAEILQLSAVGSNQQALTNLVTVGQDLALVRPLIEMMGGKSNVTDYVTPDGVKIATAIGTVFSPAGPLGALENQLVLGALAGDPTAALLTGGAEGFNNAYYSGGGLLGWMQDNSGYTNISAKAGASTGSSISSIYSGFSVGKSAASLSSASSKGSLPAIIKNITATAAENAMALSNAKFQEFLDSAEEASKTMSWEAYKETLSDYGLSDWDEALSNYGRSEAEIQGYFQANQAREGALQEAARKEDEQKFRDETRAFWDFDAGTSGIYQTAMWLPFINDEFKPFFDSGARYDQRMDAVDMALSNIQIKEDMIGSKLGDAKDFTVISALELLNTNFHKTFVSTSSVFQKCLADWIGYIGRVGKYSESISGASAWSDLRQAEGDAQNETLLALANAMNVFSADELKKLDPQMQANALLGKIVIILEAMMQQQNTQAGGLSLIDTMSALGLGVTQRTST